MTFCENCKFSDFAATLADEYGSVKGEVHTCRDSHHGILEEKRNNSIKSFHSKVSRFFSQVSQSKEI